MVEWSLHNWGSKGGKGLSTGGVSWKESSETRMLVDVISHIFLGHIHPLSDELSEEFLEFPIWGRQTQLEEPVETDKHQMRGIHLD